MAKQLLQDGGRDVFNILETKFEKAVESEGCQQKTRLLRFLLAPFKKQQNNNKIIKN